MKVNVSEILKNAKKLHFIGIGGSGMFPIVQIMKSKGYEIAGSDVLEGDIIEKERKLGCDVSIGHSAHNVDGADAVIVTAALLPGNPEVERAEQLGIPIIPRADMLGYITAQYDKAVCISGTHGKTTTSSMLTSILVLAGRNPSAVIGGKLPLIDGYGLAGSGDEMVCEACEFVDTFLHLSPAYSVILDIDNDHLDYFKTMENSIASFRKFAGMAKYAVIANADDENTLNAVNGLDGKVIFFGHGDNCKYRISDEKPYSRAFYSFKLTHDGVTDEFRLNCPGEQFVCDGAAAAAAAFELGCTAEDIRRGLDSFKGAGRRFEIVAEVNGITIADDYAHHPTELRVTLQAAKAMGYNRVFAVFQPFTYSRTKLLLDDFADALSVADQVVMTEIMGSREVNTIGIYTKDLAEKIPGSVWYEGFDGVCGYCAEHAESGDLVITLGCGDIYKAARILKGMLENR